MSTPFQFDHDQLWAASRGWLGTPFHPNSCEKRFGVCCHMLVAAIYAECGFDLGEIPAGPPGHARFNKQSIMEPWLDASAKFNRITEKPRVGDILGYKINGTIHHLGIMLSNSQFVHAVSGAGVIISPIDDPTWLKRHGATWRPQA